jgi:hypothetical protein
MKKLIFLTIAVVLTTGLYGQNFKEHVGTGWYIALPSKDTIRTFNFFQINIDTCRSRLIKYWGTPTQNTTGIMMWTNMEIPNIGKDLRINLSDQFCTKEENGNMICKSFLNEKDKAKKIKNQKPNQFRDVLITITDKANKDIIMDKTKAVIMIQLLERIIQ